MTTLETILIIAVLVLLAWILGGWVIRRENEKLEATPPKKKSLLWAERSHPIGTYEYEISEQQAIFAIAEHLGLEFEFVPGAAEYAVISKPKTKNNAQGVAD